MENPQSQTPENKVDVLEQPIVPGPEDGMPGMSQDSRAPQDQAFEEMVRNMEPGTTGLAAQNEMSGISVDGIEINETGAAGVDTPENPAQNLYDVQEATNTGGYKLNYIVEGEDTEAQRLEAQSELEQALNGNLDTASAAVEVPDVVEVVEDTPEQINLRIQELIGSETLTEEQILSRLRADHPAWAAEPWIVRAIYNEAAEMSRPGEPKAVYVTLPNGWLLYSPNKNEFSYQIAGSPWDEWTPLGGDDTAHVIGLLNRGIEEQSVDLNQGSVDMDASTPEVEVEVSASPQSGSENPPPTTPEVGIAEVPEEGDRPEGNERLTNPEVEAIVENPENLIAPEVLDAVIEADTPEQAVEVMARLTPEQRNLTAKGFVAWGYKLEKARNGVYAGWSEKLAGEDTSKYWNRMWSTLGAKYRGRERMHDQTLHMIAEHQVDGGKTTGGTKAVNSVLLAGTVLKVAGLISPLRYITAGIGALGELAEGAKEAHYSSAKERKLRSKIQREGALSYEQDADYAAIVDEAFEMYEEAERRAELRGSVDSDGDPSVQFEDLDALRIEGLSGDIIEKLSERKTMPRTQRWFSRMMEKRMLKKAQKIEQKIQDIENGVGKYGDLSELGKIREKHRLMSRFGRTNRMEDYNRAIYAAGVIDTKGVMLRALERTLKGGKYAASVIGLVGMTLLKDTAEAATAGAVENPMLLGEVSPSDENLIAEASREALLVKGTLGEGEGISQVGERITQELGMTREEFLEALKNSPPVETTTEAGSTPFMEADFAHIADGGEITVVYDPTQNIFTVEVSGDASLGDAGDLAAAKGAEVVASSPDAADVGSPTFETSFNKVVTEGSAWMTKHHPEFASNGWQFGDYDTSTKLIVAQHEGVPGHFELDFRGNMFYYGEDGTGAYLEDGEWKTWIREIPESIAKDEIVIENIFKNAFESPEYRGRLVDYALLHQADYDFDLNRDVVLRGITQLNAADGDYTDLLTHPRYEEARHVWTVAFDQLKGDEELQWILDKGQNRWYGDLMDIKELLEHADSKAEIGLKDALVVEAPVAVEENSVTAPASTEVEQTSQVEKVEVQVTQDEVPPASNQPEAPPQEAPRPQEGTVERVEVTVTDGDPEPKESPQQGTSEREPVSTKDVKEGTQDVENATKDVKEGAGDLQNARKNVEQTVRIIRDTTGI